MQRKKASDFDQRILELYDGYVHGRMSKRDFLDHAAKYTVGGVTAAAVLESLQPDYALAAQVAPDDPAITTERARIRLAGGHRHHQRPDGAAGRRRPGRCRQCWWCMRIAASTPTSRTWCGGWARPATWRSGRTG